MSYHLTEIKRGVFGEPSKITEEYQEFIDAINQENPIMALQELADMLGAIEGYAAKYNITLEHLITMKDVTKYVFEIGYRESRPAEAKPLVEPTPTTTNAVVTQSGFAT